MREAHPTDGWRMSSNDKVGIAFAQPVTKEDRTQIAKTCCASLQMTMPLLVDNIDDEVGHAYSGMPDRLYVIDRLGQVVYQGGRGPFFFKAGEMEQALAMLLLDQETPEAPAKVLQGKSKAFVPLVSQSDAWKHLPPATQKDDQPLPAWSLALAKTLPRAAAALLQLDYLHRQKNPIEARLRGQIRYVAAKANGCVYGQEQAASDLRAAGVDDYDIDILVGDFGKLPAKSRAALLFARKLTLAADTVTDEEVAKLRERFGDQQVMAMVQLLAYANFQDRLLLSLGIPAKSYSYGPARDLRFDISAAAPPVQRPKLNTVESSEGRRVLDPDWLRLDFATLKKQMEQQKARPPRIPVPTWEEVVKATPKGMKPRETDVLWSRVCVHYQPELALGWFSCMSSFRQDAAMDRVLEESIFWVITREIHCFY